MRLNRIFLLFVSVLFTTLSWAGFSISGNVITQNGTNTSLNGIQNLSGVSVSTQNNIRVYNIGDRRLVVNGNLTIDPESEMLIIGYTSGEMLVVQNNATLTIGKEINTNGFKRYSEGTAIYLDYCDPGYDNRVTFKNNATFHWYGGFISIYAGKFGFYGNNVTVRIYSKNAKLLYRTVDSQNQIRQETNDFIAEAFTFINGDFTVVSPGQQLNGYNPIHCSGAIAFSNATPNQDVLFNGYSGGGNGNIIDIKFWQGSRPVFYNSLTGSRLNAGAHLSSSSSYGVALIYQKLKVNVHSTDGQPISGARCFIRDNDNGNRETYNREGHVVNNTQDKTYTFVTNTSGESTTQNILLGSVVANTGSSNPPNTGTYAWDYRGNQNNNSDLFHLNFWSYNHQFVQLPDVVLKGVDDVNIKATLIQDNNITKTETQASSITGISINHNPNTNGGDIVISNTVSLCDLYDLLKYNKVHTDLEEPSISNLAVTAVSNTLDIGDYKLTLNAGSVLKPCSKFKKIQSNQNSTITDVSTNLEVALTDPSGVYRLVSIENLDSATFTIFDTDNSTILATDTNFTGIFNLVTQSNSNITIQVKRNGYTNWYADIDLSVSDIWSLFVFQSKLTNATSQESTLENQEKELYLLQKILMKNEAISATLQDTNSSSINLNIINQPSVNNATLEKQEELIDLLKRVLLKTTTIRKQVNKN